MPEQDSVPEAEPTVVGSSPRQEHYTGVVVVQGLSAETRSTTLQEAVSSLTYWFNHVAGLALQPDGRGRVWVRARLTDDPNPDAGAARASMELTAPSAGLTISAASSEEALRLEFREVWWADSLGLPSVGVTISWAWVQAVEQVTHLLLPIGKRLGPAQTARRTPARQISQALTYRPSAQGTETQAHPALWDLQRLLVRGVLALFGLIQYVWKLLQWLILTPLILQLLLVMGLLRLLVEFIAPLKSTVVTSSLALLDTLLLSWIAAAQVYTLDYTRSAGIRERFEREVIEFLRDDRCDRIVVVAHSMGTIIAYEGLTTIFESPEFRADYKPMTFICLAQVLRRTWLMTADDPHRRRGVLPERVRWLHFWARYDPVSAGPLTSQSLPPPDSSVELAMYTSYWSLAGRLDECENVNVVNTDSTFTDHTTYWQNLEQVVGPIAKELVAGHPELERLVQVHLATGDEILLRRWQVAWRSTLALFSGLIPAGLLVVLDVSNGNRLGQAISGAVGSVLGSSPLQRFLDNITYGLSTLIGTYLSQCMHAGACTEQQQLGQNPTLIVPYLLSYVRPEILATAATALVVLGLGIQLVGNLVATRSPFELSSVSTAAASTRSMLVLAMFSLVLAVLGLTVFHTSLQGQQISFGYPHKLPLSATIYVWSIGVAELLWILSLALGFLGALRRQSWGWVLGMPASILLVLFAAPSFAVVAAILAVTGCLALGIHELQDGRWSWATSLMVVALLLGVAVGDLLHPHTSITFGFLVVVAPLIVYGLWIGAAQFQSQVADSGTVSSILGLCVTYLLLSVIVSFIPTVPQIWVPLIIIPTLLGALAWALSVIDATRTRRWGWVVLTVLLTVLLSALTHWHMPSEQGGQILGQISLPAEPWLVWSVPLIVAALAYGLWAGSGMPPQWRKMAP